MNERPRSHPVDSIAAGLPHCWCVAWHCAMGVSMTRYQRVWAIATALIGIANLAVVVMAVAGSRERRGE